ncbi:hypothetical protein MTR_6g084330 [Medicago truncatula]|uniref:Uncharacterized protein n=1 Tax=Medicago truncatula TaxID=3880 RepID=G7KN32_MEDTR|nr:hypothetical protein MTR_6g084330 [Medicago truncatula]
MADSHLELQRLRFDDDDSVTSIRYTNGQVAWQAVLCIYNSNKLVLNCKRSTEHLNTRFKMAYFENIMDHKRARFYRVIKSIDPRSTCIEYQSLLLW